MLRNIRNGGPMVMGKDLKNGMLLRKPQDSALINQHSTRRLSFKVTSCQVIMLIMVNQQAIQWDSLLK